MDQPKIQSSQKLITAADLPRFNFIDADIEHRADYAMHSAYSEMIEKATIFDKISASLYFGINFIPLMIKRLTRYEMIPYHIRSGSLMKLAAAGLGNIFSRGRSDSFPDKRNARLEEFRQSGCVVAMMSPSEFEAIQQESAEDFEALAMRRKKNASGKREFDDSRATVNRLENPKLFETLEAIFRNNDIHQTAGLYLGREAKLIDVNPQINDKSDRFWLEIFPDIKSVEVPDAAYFHRDASGGDLKVIIYMTNVDEENGPFNYVVGSNNLRFTPADNLICEANDQNGLSGTDLSSRKRFAALPKKLRQKGSFGNDLSNNSKMAKSLVKSNWEITGSQGSMVMFDTKGIHRGGMVVAGERRVLTCVLG